ncbi:MAG TPA: hypothetical protein VFZ49_11165 [Pyrinomonadaceae bacterium]
MKPSRRQFCSTLLGSVAAHALLSSCTAAPEAVVSPKVEPILKHWAIELNEYCSDLRKANLSQRDWQRSMERLFGRIDLSELLKFIDFESLRKGFEYPDLGVATANVALPPLDGLPKDVVFLKKIFGLKRDRAIIPHGHSNMASGHLVLEGEFDLRHFEKLGQTKDHLTIRATIERKAAAGSFSSISDERDNVHWFVATSDHAYTFDVIMLDLNGKQYDIHNIDIERAEKGSNGELRAPIIEVKTALRKYGKGTIH